MQKIKCMIYLMRTMVKGEILLNAQKNMKGKIEVTCCSGFDSSKINIDNFIKDGHE